MKLAAQMQKTGVKILAGTDPPAPFVFPGPSLHDELQLLVQSGLTTIEELQAATKNPAEVSHELKDFGTVEEGKFADLLLLDANSLEDIHNTRKIRAVVLCGKLLDRLALDQLVDEKQFAANH
jgi:imidazolonepropionase-like amidohydrolase